MSSEFGDSMNNDQNVIRSSGNVSSDFQVDSLPPDASGEFDFKHDNVASYVYPPP